MVGANFDELITKTHTYGNINFMANLNIYYNIEQGSWAEEALMDVRTNIS